ncbi:MAG: flippase [Chloroflexota bacterium]
MSDTVSSSPDDSAKQDARRTASNVGVLMLTSVLSKGILFAWQIVLSNLIGPAELGIYSTVFALFAVVAPISGTSLGIIAIREIAKKPDTIGSYASTLLFLQTALSGVAYVVLVLVSTLYSDTILVYAAIAGISLILDMFGSIAHDLFLAQEKMRFTAIMEIVQIVVRVALAALALWLGYGLLGIYIATLIASVIRAICLWAGHIVDGLKMRFPIQWQALAIPLVINALPILGGAMLSLGYDHTDKLMMTGIIGEVNTGYLQPAFLIHFGIVELVSVAILNAMYPLLARYHTDANQTFGMIVEKLFFFTLLAMLPIALGITVFSDDIIQLIFSAKYLPTIPILRVYVWYTFLTVLSNVLTRSLLVQNRQVYTLFITAAALTLNIVLNLYLLVQFGDPVGAAVASVAAQGLALILLSRLFSNSGFAWTSFFMSSRRLLILATATTAIMLLAGEIFWILGLLVGSALYLAGVLTMGILSGDDWDMLYRLTSSLPGGAFIRRYWQHEPASP